MRRWWPWLLFVLALIPALFVNTTEASVNQPAPSDVTLAIFSNPNNLDPALADSPSDWAVDSNIFEPLFRTTTHGVVASSLVSHVQLSAKTVTLTIRPLPLVGGGHLTAAVVAGALSRTLWPKVLSPTAQSLLKPVVGSQKVAQGKSSFISGITVVGRDTLVFHLRQADSQAFLSNLANPALSIVPASDMLRGGPDWQLSNLYGTGGFRMTNWVPDGQLNFQKVGGQGPKTVTLMEFSSFSRALQSFENGALDFVPLDPQQLSQVPKKLQGKIRLAPLPGTVDLYYRSGAHHVSQYSHLSLSHWVHQSFSGKVTALTGNWPSSVPDNRRMTVYVDNSLPEAMALAKTLVGLEPHRVSIHLVSPAHLAKLAGKNQIGAYIGDQNYFASGISVPLVPLESFWLAYGPLRVYSTGALDWHSLTEHP